MKKIVDVKNRYNSELLKIQNKLNQLEKGRVYDPASGNHSKMDGSLSTNIAQLKEMLNDLLNKIEYSKQSDEEKLGECFEKFKI